MKIKVSHIQHFLSQAKRVHSSKLHPLSDCVRISEGKIEKSNGTISYTYRNPEIHCIDILIIEERILSCAIDGMDSDQEIEITTTKIKGNKRVSFSQIDGLLFQKMPSAGTTFVTVPNEAIGIIKTASAYTKENSNTTLDFVCLSSAGIFASDGFNTFFHAGAYPDCFLDEYALSILGSMQKAEMEVDNNHIFLRQESDEFAIVKRLAVALNYGHVINQSGTAIGPVSIYDLFNFCKSVYGITKKQLPSAQLEGNTLSYIEEGYAIEATLDCKPFPLFKFDPIRMMKVLQSLPYDVLNFEKIGPHYKLTCDDDPAYIGIVAGIN